MNPSVSGGLNDQFYVYDLVFGAVTTGATVPITVNIDSLSNFLWRATTFFGYPDGANFTTPFVSNIIRPFTLSLTDSATGRTFFSAATPIDNVAGDGKFPFVLPEPYLWAANSVIQAILVNLDTHTWDNVTLSLIGKKTFHSFPVG